MGQAKLIPADSYVYTGEKPNQTARELWWQEMSLWRSRVDNDGPKTKQASALLIIKNAI